MCLRDTILPTGGGRGGTAPIYACKGDHLMASLWGVHQDPSIWGPDGAEFRPPWTEARRVGFTSKYGTKVGLFPAETRSEGH